MDPLLVRLGGSGEARQGRQSSRSGGGGGHHGESPSPVGVTSVAGRGSVAPCRPQPAEE
jgi:hypothetical protein